MQLRDALELMGQANASTLSLRLRLPQAITAAMLERLEMMGQAERVTGDDTAAGACCACSRSAHCRLPCYRLRSPAVR